jgi:hypothetical protein
MTIDTEKTQRERIEPPPRPTSLVRAELPRWAPWGIFGASLVVVGTHGRRGFKRAGSWGRSRPESGGGAGVCTFRSGAFSGCSPRSG